MVVYHCCVPNCTASTRKFNKLHKYPWMQGVTFISLPNKTRNAKERRDWLRLIRRPNDWTPTKYTRICSLHFDENNNNTLPTLFPYNNFKKPLSERKILPVTINQANFSELKDIFLNTKYSGLNTLKRCRITRTKTESAYHKLDYSGDTKKDIGHILDFITRVKCLHVKGQQQPVGSSNILMAKLKFDLTLYKSLECVELEHCDPLLISGLETNKQSIEHLFIHYSLNSIRDIMLQDIPHWKAEDGTMVVSHWENLIEVDFSHNSILHIDDSVQLIPRVEVLDLSYNKLESIEHLNWLSQLTILNLSYNNISHLDSLHTKLGNLKKLNLAGNKLSSLSGRCNIIIPRLATYKARKSQETQTGRQ
ncbi:Hypothetical predicted protein [Mytilus galloprovincialis]|uniref:THAP-type domain-containing protein n=1 Tax=Mytilus galloprovincialis TaxID=29158 RepID=A0A8B6CK48_MYTGA|nr:Hypothetical predicted protein [Mytilus galloprovincialis]